MSCTQSEEPGMTVNQVFTLRAALIAPFLLILSATPSPAQDFSPEEKEMWRRYNDLKIQQLDNDALRLIRRNKEVVIRIFDKLLLHICESYHPDDIDDAKFLVADLDKSFKDPRYAYRLNYMISLNVNERHKRLGAWNDYYYGYEAFARGEGKKCPVDLNEACRLLKRAIAPLEEIEDHELLGEICMRIAICYELLELPYEACVYFDRSMKAMANLPFKPGDLKYVKYRYDHFIKEGFDPTKPKDGGGMPRKTKSEEAEQLPVTEFHFQEPAILAGLSYETMKHPHEFVTPAFNSAANPYLWPDAWFDANKKWHEPFQLLYGYRVSFYGKPIHISKVRSKYFLDIDGNEKTRREIKAGMKIGKLSLVDSELGADRRPYRYQFFMQIPSDEEEMFGLVMKNTAVKRNTINVRVRTGCYTRGRILNKKCILIDDNGNGIFGDCYRMTDDYITYGDYFYWRPDAFQFGREKKARPWSRFQLMDGRFYAMEVDPYGRKIKATPVEVETGHLRFAFNGDVRPLYLILRLIDENNPGAFFDVADYRDPVTLPAGAYEIACGKIETGKRGRVKQVRIYHGKAKKIIVEAGQETRLELGAPFSFTFDTCSTAGELIVKGNTVNVWGAEGELYAQFFDTVPQPTVCIRNRKTLDTLLKGKEMKLPTLDDYYYNRGSEWHPLDFKYETSIPERLQVRLVAGKVELLGGPLTSNWK
jgi:hypothetical protein